MIYYDNFIFLKHNYYFVTMEIINYIKEILIIFLTLTNQHIDKQIIVYQSRHFIGKKLFIKFV